MFSSPIRPSRHLAIPAGSLPGHGRRPSRLADGRAALSLVGAAMAPVWLRLAGSPVVLAGLRVCATEPGREWVLGGAKSRDRLPPDGALVQAMIRMEDRILTFQAEVLGCRWEDAGKAGQRPMIRLGWPADPPAQQLLTDDPAQGLGVGGA